MSEIYETFKGLLTFPSLSIVLLIIGLALFRFRRLSFAIIAFSTLSLYILSTPFASTLLANSLETYPALTSHELMKPRAQAIVVLGGGRNQNAPEYNGEDTSSMYELPRIQYAAFLYRKTHLPILMTGGMEQPKKPSEAAIMAKVMRDSFKIPTKWLEERSPTTYFNAKYTAQVLRKEKIKTIYLVTDAVHMPRSIWCFKKFGFDVIPAPTGFFTDFPLTPFSFMLLIPNMFALDHSAYCLREYTGMLWYRWRYNR